MKTYHFVIAQSVEAESQDEAYKKFEKLLRTKRERHLLTELVGYKGYDRKLGPIRIGGILVYWDSRQGQVN